MTGRFQFPTRTAVICLTAALFISLAADWVAPGEATAATCAALREGAWPLSRIGWDVAGLGALSFAGALVTVWLWAVLVEIVFKAAVRQAEKRGTGGEREFVGVVPAAVLLASLAFALTPGFLRAATRLGPLMASMVPPMAAVTLVVWAVATRRETDELPATNYQLPTANYELIARLKAGKLRLFIALLLLGWSAYVVYCLRRVWWAERVSFLVFALIGVLPALAFANFVRTRRMVSRKVRLWCFGGWAVAVLVLGGVAFGGLSRGYAANRLAALIVANAEGREQGIGNGVEGKIALVSDGTLDDLLTFMLPKGVKLISLARDRDPAYGRALSDWVASQGPAPVSPAPTNDQLPATNYQLSPAAVRCPLSSVPTNNALSTKHQALSTHKVEDLAFAAELGPRALIDEWAKLDKPGFEARVATPATYFPTVEKWREACRLLADADDDEPLAPYLRRLLGVCGNELGCRALEKVKSEEFRVKNLKEAWEVFCEVADKVDRENYTALLNLAGMIERGEESSARGADVTRRLDELARRLGSAERVRAAMRSCGRLYVDSATAARLERERKDAEANRKPTLREEAFIAAATKPPESRAECKIARETLENAVRDGLTLLPRVGHQLVSLDIALGDWERAEQDAIRVLRLDRHHPTANAAMGALNGMRGDYRRAEEYLRRSSHTALSLNDLAFTLARLGKASEAVPLARKAVAAEPDNWNFRETLAYALIRAGTVEEGERELTNAVERVTAAGRRSGEVVRFDIDRAWLLKAKGDRLHLNMTLRSLQGRKNLTESQRKEIEEIAAK